MMANENDELFDAVIERQLIGLRVEAGQRKEVKDRLRDLQSKLVAATAVIAPTDVTARRYQQQRLVRLLDQAKLDIAEAYKEIGISQASADKAYAAIEVQAASAVSESLGIMATVPSKSNVIEAIGKIIIEGAPSATWWKRQAVDLQQRFADGMTEGVLQGETTQKLVQRVRGTRKNGFTDGIMNATTKNAEALVRTSVQRVGNEARLAFWDANNGSIEFYKHSSTLDSRTSHICAVRDGKRWDAQTKEPVGHGLSFRPPPVHWNCRSALIPIIKGIGEPEDAFRSSDQGEVPAKTTFEQFLKKKPVAWQDEVLGKGKADLYRKGKIGFTDLLDQSGNPITLEQLQNRKL